jgi:GGDEF domain-containing protein
VSDDPLDPRVAERLIRAVRAAQTLSETLWEALDEELSDPRTQRVLELSEQLGVLAATIASLARTDARSREARAVMEDSQPRAARVPDTPRVPDNALASRAEAPSPPAPVPAAPSAPVSAPGESLTPPEPPSPAVLVDELAPTSPDAGAQVTQRTESPRPTPETHGRGAVRPLERSPQIEIKDERGEDGPTAWIGSIGRRLERREQDFSPFAVLLIELVGIERLRHAESPEELSRLMGQVEETLARGLRPADSLTREGPGRYWLLAPQTDGAGAQILAERIARGVRSSASHRGTPLEVAVGIAACPEDGLQASQLAAHADVELYAARAAGRYR